MRVCVCVLNADHIDCNVELIKMGDILISAGNKVFWVIFMGKMVTNLCTPSLSELLLRVSKVHGSNCSLVRREIPGHLQRSPLIPKSLQTTQNQGI